MEDWGLPTASCKVWDGVTVTELNNLAKSAQKELVPLTKIYIITLYYSTATELEDRGVLWWWWGHAASCKACDWVTEHSPAADHQVFWPAVDCWTLLSVWHQRHRPAHVQVSVMLLLMVVVVMMVLVVVVMMMMVTTTPLSCTCTGRWWWWLWWWWWWWWLLCQCDINTTELHMYR